MKENKIINLKEVSTITNLSVSTILRLEEQKTFPRRIQLSKRRVGWLSGDISKWILRDSCPHNEKEINRGD